MSLETIAKSPLILLVAAGCVLAGCSDDEDNGAGGTGGTPGTGGFAGGIDGNGGSPAPGTGGGNMTGSGGTGSGGQPATSGHYFEAGAWKGYGYTSAGPTEGGTVSELSAGFISGSAPVCISGTLVESYSSLGIVGMAVNQAEGSEVEAEWTPGDYEGVHLDVTRNVDSGLRMELLAADGTSYCVQLSADEATLPWSRFETECWGSEGETYDPSTPLVRVQFYAPGDENSVVDYDYCVNELKPVEEAGGGLDPDHKFVGNITTSYDVRSDFIDYWDQITPENEGKWSSVEGTRDQYNWASVDESYDYSREHGIPFKQHTFVWGNQSPGWIESLPPAEQAAEIEEWIRDFCERYPDTEMIDVVNESTPGHAPAGYAESAFGSDWIIDVFNLADEYCPNSVLILNDYNVLTWNTDEFITMATPAVNAGVVDAIGLQAHGMEDWSLSDLEANLNKVLTLGLPVYIAEYDVNIENDQEQLEVMQEQFTFFYEHPSVKGITLWGYVYGSTWVDHSGLIYEDGTPRPAMTWLMDYLGRN